MNKVEKCSQSQKNRIVINNGVKELRVYDYELNHYLDNGWNIGWTEQHKKNCSKSKSGKSIASKGKSKNPESVKKMKQTLKAKHDSGELTAWNKGLSSSTDDRIAKQHEKACETNLIKYGCKFPKANMPMSENHKKAIGDANRNKSPRKLTPVELEIKTTKQYLTRKKNNSFNSSKPEQDLYEQLLNENKTKTIYRNYKDKERYPFYCDFYIKEDDLFIELNAHWTHGGKPFNPNDKDCLEQLAIWEEKAKTSKFFLNAIETWTVRDVKKLECAKKNNLNYKVIY